MNRLAVQVIFSIVVLTLAGSSYAAPAAAFGLPTGFENVEVLNGLAEPDGMAFALDGRLFIAERVTGRLLVAKQNGAQWVLNTEPFYTFDIPKNASGEPEARRSAGLRDIAFDPNFANNGFVYAFYMDNDTLHNRVIRLKASTTNPDVADSSIGEEMLIDLPFNGTSSSGSHNGGALEFGLDGKLYITAGDGWEGEFAGDPVQSLTTFTGKVLRINADGSIPTDNPFYDQTAGSHRAIYALGLRNPYSMSINPASGKLYINEARGSNKASIYIVEAGANYGHEGGASSGIGTVRNLWANASGAGSELITGGAWYPAGGLFPSEYHGRYFVALWGSNGSNRGQISTIQSESDTFVEAFERDVGLSTDPPVKPVITRIGPDGNLYYLLTTYQTTSGTLQMVRYTGGESVAPPAIVPNGGTFTAPVTVALDVATSGAQIRYTIDNSEPTAASTLYTAPFTLSATTLLKAKAFKDGLNASSTSSALFTIGEPSVNIPPVVDAGEDKTIQLGQTTALDGSGTYDPDGEDDLLRDEQWLQLSGPPLTIEDSTEEVAYITPQEIGEYTFQLTVSDGFDSGTDSVTIRVIEQTACASDGLLALYAFGEGSGTLVVDSSGVSPTLNLTIADGANASWMPNGGLSLDGATTIASSGAAIKLIDAAKASNEITIEAWIKPTNVTQDGPARIVSLSGSPTSRNITLGQGTFGNNATDVFDVRLRTTDGGNNDNGEPSMTTPSGSATVASTHVIYTLSAAGTTRIYVNGSVVTSGSAGGTLSNWRSFPLTLGNEASGDRPWLGELHEVAIYRCALDTTAVAAQFRAGPGGTVSVPPTPVPTSTPTVTPPTTTPRILLFSKTAGFRHSSIANARGAIEQLGIDKGFMVDFTTGQKTCSKRKQTVQCHSEWVSEA